MPTILVVDDSATDRVRVGGLLEKTSGFAAVYAENGREALEMLERCPIGLVVTDLQMPEIDGLKLVRRMREEYPLIPVVLITAAGSEKIAVQALQDGAAGYVRKKSLANSLVETVNQILDASEQDLAHAEVMQQMTLNEYEFDLDNELSLLAPLVRHLQQAMRSCGFCEPQDNRRIGVALDEALMNAYYHGNLEVSSELREEDYQAFYDLAEERIRRPPYNTRRIQLLAKLSPDEVRFTVQDDGPGFDVSKLPDPTDPANIERPSGRGILLMRMFMDEVTFNDAGNRITIVRRRGKDSND